MSAEAAEVCTICTESNTILHSHHTIPRSRGGENSLQILLCSNCHNSLHANAVHVVARMRNPKRNPAKTFWKTVEIAKRAEPWLQILVRALITPNAESAEATEFPIGVKLSSSDFQLFKLLAAELGCSQEKAVEYCVKYVLRTRGFKSEKTKPELWFLPISNS